MQAIAANIPAQQGRAILQLEKYTTQNIIEEVLEAFQLNKNKVAAFAQSCKGATVLETASNVWYFVKTQIHYQADPPRFQWVKSPSRLWADKEGDCKSFSIFSACVLYSLGIPVKFRFASYSALKIPTHVYCFIPLPNGQEIIVDAVWTAFNSQKAYTYKIDYPAI